MLPPIPSWDALHVLVVHFPVALLVTVPLLIFLALILPKLRRDFTVGAFVAVLLGTVAVFLAVSTGEAAGELADHNPQIDAVLAHHQQLATTARIFFGLFTLLLGALLIGPTLLKRPIPVRVHSLLLVVTLVVGLGGGLLVANIAHQGGRLVHVFGVRAMIEATPSATSLAAPDED